MTYAFELIYIDRLSTHNHKCWIAVSGQIRLKSAEFNQLSYKAAINLDTGKSQFGS